MDDEPPSCKCGGLMEYYLATSELKCDSCGKMLIKD